RNVRGSSRRSSTASPRTRRQTRWRAPSRTTSSLRGTSGCSGTRRTAGATGRCDQRSTLTKGTFTTWRGEPGPPFVGGTAVGADGLVGVPVGDAVAGGEVAVEVAMKVAVAVGVVVALALATGVGVAVICVAVAVGVGV